ncbi:hypothetical protein B4U45_13795 [Mycobacterium persicum]|uniref:Uncharacterized protein n=1 Tax=Mycobacterium persicum TaxID=1487726 RepID=A0A8E2ISY3_9MYCO|nr:hypothetical protein [Mycobacterium persicum]KZS78855.1 hypothetical protein A4G31_12605 [Mycobacterium persicum]ORB56827.1 hypothetical protein BST40_04275 [Mycobacterium persicum]ORB95543.1 hypothetical protein B1T44_14765 [Mycobacterium persicum]ORC02310.1 hypothetical protein B1T48_14640 [Mycobacterium persicum]ORC07511.1 hypothetical protein B4U45_13795 [Mycobacterium persicum]
MIRQHGVVASAAGLVPFGHLGWGYSEQAQFRARAAEYIVDGRLQNQWVEYVGARSRDELRSEFAAMPALSEIRYRRHRRDAGRRVLYLSARH